MYITAIDANIPMQHKKTEKRRGAPRL